jgi:hypothetical protein
MENTAIPSSIKASMITLQSNNITCHIYNGDDLLGQQIILKYIYLEELSKIQPLRELDKYLKFDKYFD